MQGGTRLRISSSTWRFRSLEEALLAELEDELLDELDGEILDELEDELLDEMDDMAELTMERGLLMLRSWTSMSLVRCVTSSRDLRS